MTNQSMRTQEQLAELEEARHRTAEASRRVAELDAEIAKVNALKAKFDAKLAEIAALKAERDDLRATVEMFDGFQEWCNSAEAERARQEELTEMRNLRR
jgi:hypothetical protein